MPAIWLRVMFKGRKDRVEADSLLNSGSDLVVLPRKVADSINPNPVGEVEIELANGRVVRRNVYEIEVEVENPETKERRKAKVLSTVGKKDYQLIGVIAFLEKLRLIPDVVAGKVFLYKDRMKANMKIAKTCICSYVQLFIISRRISSLLNR